MHPVQIDVFYPLPEGWGMCSTCEMFLAEANLGGSPEKRGLDEYPPEWQEELRQLSSLIYSIAESYHDSVRIRIWDPRSLQGMWKSIRHGVRRYPTFIINGRTKLTGWDKDRLEKNIQAAGKMSKSEI